MTAMIRRYQLHASIAVLVILYAVGLVGLQTTEREWFMAATPITLIISAILLLLNQRQWNFSTSFAAITAVLLGFWIEVIGVKTGLVFGQYAYGETLGLKFMSVPLVIGVNWLLLTFAVGSVVARMRIPTMARVLLGATLMTALDVLIEPIAMKLDFWQWPSGVVPIHNYLGWIAVAFLMQLLFQYLRFPKQNPAAAAVLALQIVFFATLHIID